MLSFTFLVVVAFISSLYTLRMYFDGLLVGDPFDTRLQIAQHEHWFRFYKGQSDFRDTLFFYPFNKALGFTDGLFLPALPYSLMRQLEVHPVESWFIASFLFLLLGNLGWVFVARKILRSKFLQLSFIWSISNLPTFVILLERAPQIITFSWISWLFFLTLMSIQKYKKNETNLYFIALLILTPLLMITSWYPVFFYFSTVALSLLMYLTLNYKRKELKNQFNRFIIINKKAFLITLPITTTLLLVWLYIHLSVYGDTKRSWNETIYYSSYFAQIINQEFLNNGWYYFIIKKFQYDPFQQSNVALPIILLVLSVFFIVLSFFTSTKKIKIFRNFMVFSGLILFIVFLRLTEEFSFYRILWENIPGLQSIRFPYRYLIVFGFILVIFIYINFDELLKKHSKNNPFRIGVYFFILILLVDNFKPYYAIWGKDEYLYKNLKTQMIEIKEKCDFFILDSPGGWWDDQISAISLSVLTGVPTANGYSGGFPNGYPVKDWNYEGDISGVLKWANFGSEALKGCLVSNSHEIIYSNPSVSNIYFHSGFSPMEMDSKENIWRWAESNQGYIIFSVPRDIKNFQFQFSLKTAECLDQTKLIIYEEPDKIVFEDYITKKNQDYILNFKNNSTTIKQLKFMTEDEYCNFDGDPRNLYFEIKNFKINPT